MGNTVETPESSDQSFINGLADDDVVHALDTQVRTANLLLPVEGDGAGPVGEFQGEEVLWNAVLAEEVRSNSIITLNDFLLFEWFPRAPGLYFTREAALAREQALQFIDKKMSTPRLTVFTPYGKAAMLKGGVGNIRLRDREIAYGPATETVWFMAASSSGVSHKGFPIALPQHFFKSYIDRIATTGAMPCVLRGSLKFIPKDLATLYNSSCGVPQLYLLVEDARESVATDTRQRLRVNVAVTFSSDFEAVGPGRHLYACYVSFDPADRESYASRLSWMEHEYIRGKYEGRIVTDFDEQKTHFPDAPFSLNRIMDNQMDRADVQMVVDAIGRLNPAPTYTTVYGNVDALFTGRIQINNARAEHGGLAKIVTTEGTMSSTQGETPKAAPSSGDTVSYIGGNIGDQSQVTVGSHVQNQSRSGPAHRW